MITAYLIFFLSPSNSFIKLSASSIFFLYIFLWIAYKRENKYLFLAAILSIFASWAKQEGTMFSLINMALLFLFIICAGKAVKKTELRGIFYFTLAIVMASAAWFGYLNIMRFSHETFNKASFNLAVISGNLNRIPLILYEYQKHIFGPKKWNISLLIFFAGLLFYHKKAFTGDFKYITISILAGFLGYGFVFVITPLEIRYHLQTTGSRLLLHFLPLVVFWIGYLAKEISDAEGNIHR